VRNVTKIFTKLPRLINNKSLDATPIAPAIIGDDIDFGGDLELGGCLGEKVSAGG